MSARVTIDGLAELRQFISGMPGEVQALAADAIREATEGAKADIQSEYPQRSGVLRGRVRTRYANAGLRGQVNSQAPHAHLFEGGTKVRQTKRGANRGRMPKSPVTPGVAYRRRFILQRQLVGMLRNLGFTVTGV